MPLQLTFATFSDTALIDEVTRLAAIERRATAHLIGALAEFDARRLYLGQGCASLFVYCTRVLHLSEHAAYGRTEAARAARRIPTILEMLDRGELTLTSIVLIAPHLTLENHADLRARAKLRTRREVEELVAAIRPKPEVPATVRRVPAQRLHHPVTDPPPRANVNAVPAASEGFRAPARSGISSVATRSASARARALSDPVHSGPGDRRSARTREGTDAPQEP